MTTFITLVAAGPGKAGAGWPWGVLALWLTAASLVAPSTAAAAGSPTAASRDLLLLVDNSGSMKQNDPQRLAARSAAGFVGTLQPQDRVGLILFDGSVRMPVPLTAIADGGGRAVVAGLAALDYGGQRTDSPGAVERALYELRTRGRLHATRAIVFLTDGLVDVGDAARDLELRLWLREELAGEAAGLGVAIHSIAFTGEADFLLAQSLAQRTGGEYFRAPRAEDIDAAFQRIDRLTRSVEDRAAPAEASGTGPAATAPPGAATPDSGSNRARIVDVALAPEVAENRPIPISVLRLPRAVPAEPAAIGSPLPVAGEDLALAAGACLPGLVLAGVWLRRRRARRRAVAAAAATAVENAEPAPRPALARPAAVLQGGGDDGRTLALQHGPLMVGRVGGEDGEDRQYLVIARRTIGRRHALIEYRDHAYWVEDLRSLNGTYLNDRRIERRQRLKHGDRVRFHDVEFEFAVPDLDGFEATCVADAATARALEPSLPPADTGTGRHLRFDDEPIDPEAPLATPVKRFDRAGAGRAAAAKAQEPVSGNASAAAGGAPTGVDPGNPDRASAPGLEPAAGSPVTESFEVPTQALVGGSPGGEDAALQRTDVFDMGEELAEIALCETDDPGEIERLMRHAAERDPRGTPVGP